MFELPDLIWWQWALVAVITVAAVCYRRTILLWIFRFLAPKAFIGKFGMMVTKRDLIRIREDLAQELVGAVSPSLIKCIVADIPYSLTEHISTLMASKMRLEEELCRRGEFLVGVHLRGFKLGDDDKGDYYVPVYVGAGGTLRAPSDPKQRMIVRQDHLWDQAGSPFRDKVKSVTGLGAPWYSRVTSWSEAIVMLGETYTLLRVKEPAKAA